MTQPNNPEAEQAILGAILIRNEAILEIPDITPECFYSTQNAKIFSAMKQLWAEKTPIDLITTRAKLIEQGRSQKKDEEYMTSLADFVSSSYGIKHHAEIIYDLHLRSKLSTMGRLIADHAHKLDMPVDELKSLAKTMLMELDTDKSKDYKEPAELINSTFKIIETRNQSGQKIGYLTGFTDIDERVHGLAPSETYFLKATSKSGKSALTLNIVDNVLSNYDGYGLYFTHESTAEYLEFRRLARHTNISLTRLLTGNIFDHEWEKIVNVNSELSCKQLIIIDKSKYSKFDNMRAFCESFALDHKILFIVNDYMGLMYLSGQHQSRHIELSRMTNQFNYLAKDLDCPVITISQVNEDGKAKESRDIEDNADNVWFLEREEESEKAKLTGQKGKNIGSWGPVYLRFDKHKMAYSDYIETENERWDSRY